MQPRFVIVDIETTGGTARFDRITEIGIVTHDGEKVIDTWSSLVNPECEIPYFITRLTGISNDMVVNAPKFHEIAKEIVTRTEDAVFVAHNVRFDYDFIKKEFAQLGYTYVRKQLCTVRLSRAAFPGLPSYSLGKLIPHFNIKVKDRHRALADAEATAIVFGKILQVFKDQGKDVFGQMLPTQMRNTSLPLGWTVERLFDIPDECGVYYLHDAEGRVIYVGKSIHIRQRLFEHFKDHTGKAATLQKIVADVTVELTGSELAAELLEAHEIKRLMPNTNKAQKKSDFPFAVFALEDEQGYLTFKVDKNTQVNRKKGNLVAELLRASETRHYLYNWADRYNLCLKKVGWQQGDGPCFFHQVKKCNGACVGAEPAEAYNERVNLFAKKHGLGLEGSFLLVDKGRTLQERTVVHVQDGEYQGFGYIDVENESFLTEDLLESIESKASTPDIQRIIRLQMAKKQTTLKVIPL